MDKAPVKQFENKPWQDLSDSDDSDVECEIDVDKLAPLEIGPNDNRLQYTYCLWFSRKGTHRSTDYSKSLRFVGRCASVQQWWSLYSHLIRPTALAPYRELSLFKQGIKPMWEDPANMKGGQWVIRLRKNRIDRAWENVCMAMLGEQFLVGDEICGIVLTTKYPAIISSQVNTLVAIDTCLFDGYGCPVYTRLADMVAPSTSNCFTTCRVCMSATSSTPSTTQLRIGRCSPAMRGGYYISMEPNCDRSHQHDAYSRYAPQDFKYTSNLGNGI